MKPVEFAGVNARFAEHQDEYLTLPAYVDESEVISCWRLTVLERLCVLVTGRLWLRQLTFGEPLQPQLPQIECPFKYEKVK